MITTDSLKAVEQTLREVVGTGLYKQEPYQTDPWAVILGLVIFGGAILAWRIHEKKKEVRK